MFIRFQRGNSIIEVIVVITILTIGIVGTYNIINNGQKLSSTAENRIKAINIAREWLEAVENIRDTNWIKFSSDYDNCWKVKDYNINCIGVPGKEFTSGSYILIQSGSLWTLSGTIIPSTTYTTYLGQFPIFLDNNSLPMSIGNNTPCSSFQTRNCKTIFTREIQISHPDATHMKINSIVKWVDSSLITGPHMINFETILTNWKRQF